MPIAGHSVNLRSGPGTNYPVVQTIDYGKSVQIIRRQDSVVTVGEILGKWTLVRLANNRQLWVLDYYLALEEFFVQVHTTQERTIAFCIGDYCPHMSFHANGDVTIAQASCLGGACTLEQKREECQKSNGIFKEIDPNFYQSASCTRMSAAKVYRNIFRVDDVYIIFKDNGKACILHSYMDSCQNEL